jgi:hypothetical protein
MHGRVGMDDRELVAALQGLDFPAPRNKLISKALENGAPREVIDRIRELPETADYHDPEQLGKALGVAVPATRPDGGWE